MTFKVSTAMETMPPGVCHSDNWACFYCFVCCYSISYFNRNLWVM